MGIPPLTADTAGVRLLAEGKRAVLVAALRMRAAEESLEEVKRHAQGWQKTVIQIPPRALVQTFLRYLHPLAIAHLCPLADAPYLGNRSPGGYYWDVNGHGLLARCCHPHGTYHSHSTYRRTEVRPDPAQAPAALATRSVVYGRPGLGVGGTATAPHTIPVDRAEAAGPGAPSRIR